MSVPVAALDKRLSALALPPDDVGVAGNVAMFLQSFPTIAETKGGFARMRRLVLDLAIRGDLSSAQRTDDAVRDLLHAATKDRIDRLRNGSARQMVELEPPSAGERPFEVPGTWAWTRVGLAMNLVNGRAFKPSDWSASGLPIVRIQNLNDPSAKFNYCAFAVESKHIVLPGHFLISWSGTPGTSFGAFIWDRPEGVLNQHIFRAEVYGQSYDLRFLRIAINARLDEMIARAHGAVGLQHITKGELESMLIPLPPMAEQKRIVAKVDELMRLIDELEGKLTKKRETQARLCTAAFDAFTSAPLSEQFDAAWKRVAENFGVLIDRSETLSGMRRSIVAIALRGRLVRRELSEGTANDLIAALPVRAKFPQPDSVEQPFPLPPQWRWVPLGTLIVEGPKNGYSPKAVEHETTVKTLTLTATTSGRFDGRFFKYLDEKIPPTSDLWLRDGDILVQRGNTIDYVGVAAVYRGAPTTFIYPDLMIKLRVSAELDVDFIHMAINGPVARAFVMSRASGTSGTMPKINQATLMAIPIPICSLGEQRRIVAKVKGLMTLCDELSEKFHRAQAQALQLADAAVAKLVASEPRT